MSAEQVALIPECVECDALWLPADEARWQLHVADLDELVWYCPDCAEREFRLRPFHDLRHTAITHDAASGASEIAVMSKAGHSSMETTRLYLHLAGTVFRAEAERLEARLLGEPSTEPSTNLSASEST